MKEEKSLKDLINSNELSELNVNELMEVQGGIDNDQDLDTCNGASQCSGAPAQVVYYRSN